MTAIAYVAARRDRSPDPVVGNLAFLEDGVLTFPGGRTAAKGRYVLYEVLADDAAEAVADWVQANDSADDTDTVDVGEEVAERLLDRFCSGGPAATVTHAGWLHACAYWAHVHRAKKEDGR